MVVPYFKKKKMYEMLGSLVDIKLDMMKNASYRYYRGSEWLECESDDLNYYKKYKLYHAEYFISLDIFQWDENEDKYVEIDRITYKMVEGQLVKVYQRTKAYKVTEEIGKWLENRKEIKYA